MKNDLNNLLVGHRQRVKDNLNKNYNKNYIISDQDLLELILFYSIPRKDVKNIAKQLLFLAKGDINKVLYMQEDLLRSVPGIADNTITLFNIIKLTSTTTLRKNIINKHILSNWHHLLDYCYSEIAHESIEYVKILYMNSKSMLIDDKTLQEGTINYSHIYPREIVKHALKIGATAVIIAHNHPSGDLNPSKEDIASTKHIIKVLSAMDISLHDHIIIANSGIASLKNMGFI